MSEELGLSLVIVGDRRRQDLGDIEALGEAAAIGASRKAAHHSSLARRYLDRGVQRFGEQLRFKLGSGAA